MNSTFSISQNKLFHQLFEEQVLKTPNKIAVVYEKIRLTYAELNKKANQVAHYLHNNFDIQGDDIVALCLDRSEHIIIGILGILKSGAGYVPIDPNFPDERISFILSDTKAKAIITNDKYKVSTLVPDEEMVLAINDKQFVSNVLSKQPTHNPNFLIKENDLAYVIFTSGTTGKPKGVMVEHRNLAYYAIAAKNNIGISDSTRSIVVSDYVYVLGNTGIFPLLVGGGEIHISNKNKYMDSDYLLDYITENSINFLKCTPLYFEAMLLDELVQKNKLFDGFILVLGGESCSSKMGETLFNNEQIHVINHFCPTEIPVGLIANPSFSGVKNFSIIGKSLENSISYILDVNLKPVADGETGELYIGGHGPARGYLNRPELTAGKFINNPFQTVEENNNNINGKLYKSGDLVRYLPDGNIEFVSRNDFQVKIRGYRVELGEIEAKLTQFPEVKQAIILAKASSTIANVSNDNKYLVAYYVSDKKLDEKAMLKYLAEYLPEYMMPSAFVYLEQLPLTINGKLDRAALPDPELTSEDTYVSPSTPLEHQVTQVYSEVLGIDVTKIGMVDDFFKLGGNSILAIKLVGRLKRELKLSVTIATIYKHKTITKLIQDGTSGDIENTVIPRALKSDIYPLSYTQERFWFIENLEGGTNAYNISLLFQINSAVDIDRLKKCFLSVMERHEVLRSLIKTDSQGRGYQIVDNNPIDPLFIKHIYVNSTEELHRELTKEENYIYDLEHEFPIRIEIITNKDDNSACLCVVVQHIAFSGWSIDLLFHELVVFYDYYTELDRGNNTTINLENLSIQYKDYAVWHRGYLSGVYLEHELDYWTEKLKNFETLNLPLDKQRPAKVDHKGADLFFSLNEETSIKLRSVAAELKVSLYSLLLSGFYILLKSYSNQNDIVVGSPISNRNLSQLENLIGCFVNTLALRAVINPNSTIVDFIHSVGSEINDAQLHQELPFEMLVNALNVPHDPSRHPVFQVMFGVQGFRGNMDVSPDATKGLGKLLHYFVLPESYNVAKFDLTLIIDDSKQQLSGGINYATSLFEIEDIKNIKDTYILILEQLSDLHKNSSRHINEIAYLKRHYQKVIFDWNNTDKEFPHDKTIYQIFEEQVSKTPENIALVFQDKKLTYKELNEKANQLAHYLRKTYEIKPDDLIALCLNRTEHMLITILAVLKSGAAYVPMDPTYPEDRILYVLEDTKAKVLLTNECHQEMLKALNINYLLAIDSKELQSKLASESVHQLINYSTSSNLAYVIFTSGTTGKPKGVMIEHRGVINQMYQMVNALGLNGSSKVAQFANYVFDASVFELFPGLAAGTSIDILPQELINDTNLLSSYFIKNKITHSFMSTAYYKQIDMLLENSSLEVVHIGGESIAGLKSIPSKYRLLNQYGPTEATVCSTQLFIDNLDSAYIGRPIDNTIVYILDENLHALPIGAIGELYIGGVALARGYLNRPDLTAEKFINNPFQTELEKQTGKNAKLYKTGDLVRYLPDGNIEYHGRNDFQVKIRGYRIEIGEIETKLSTFPGVNQNVVLALDQANGNKYLVAYYVSDAKLNESEIVDYLSNLMPEYMVPSALVYLEKLPLTINGKLDKKSLPEPDFTSVDNYVAPRNETENNVCKIIAEVLGLEESKVGIKDDFFKLGGDSIVSIQLVSRLRQRLGLLISVKDIFNNKTVEKLYDNVLLLMLNDTTKSVKSIINESGVLSQELGMLPIQDWFFGRVRQNAYNKPAYWNQAFLVKTPKLDLELLKLSVIKLIEYHDALRIKYRINKDGNYEQYYDTIANSIVSINYFSLNGLDNQTVSNATLQDNLSNWQSNFELFGTTPLYTAGYIDGFADGTNRVFFAVHHLIIDAVSWRVIANDLSQIYAKFADAKTNNSIDQIVKAKPEDILGIKGTSYRQWVNIVKSYKEKNPNEISYWKKELSELDSKQTALLELQSNQITHHEFTLSKEETNALLTQVNEVYGTEINDILLSGFGLALAKLNNQNTNYITLEGHGREEIDKETDINRTVGWFTSMYPVKLSVNDNSIAATIINVKESLRVIPNKGIGYGSINSYNRLPRVSFNYLGQFSPSSTKDSNEWFVTGEKSGITVSEGNRNPLLINVNGLIKNGELVFRIAGTLTKESLVILKDEFKQTLEKIITHTSSLDRKYLTSSDINNIISQKHLDDLQKDREIENIFLANNLQQGFIYHAVNQGNADTAYRVQLVSTYNNELKPELFRKAWESAVLKYPALRLRFAWDEHLIQIIDKKQDLNWSYYDVSNQSDQQQAIDKIIIEDRSCGYDLKLGNLLRIHLIKCNNEKYVCIQSSHHAILDGWSNPVLLEFVHNLYVELLQNEAQHQTIIANIKPEETYLVSQKYLQDTNTTTEAYWQNKISSIESYIDLTGVLKANRRGTVLAEYKYIEEQSQRKITLSNENYLGLKKINQEHGITLNAILQYVWHKLLNVYGNSNTTIVGMPVSGRDLPIDGIEDSVGLYINTLPLILQHDSNETLISVLSNLQAGINDINANSNVSLAKLQPDGRRLFESLFVFENYPSITNKQNIIKRVFDKAVEELDYPLAVACFDRNEEIIINLKYAGELFTEQTIISLLNTYQTLISQIVQSELLNTSVKQLSILDQESIQQIVYDLNSNEIPYPEDKLISSLFEEQVLKTPDNIAVVYEDTKLTYNELNARANQLAAYLIDNYKIKPDDIIALCLDRSEMMIVSILGILKAGGAYVPIDSSYPIDRMEYILTDSSAKAVLVSANYLDKITNIKSTHQLSIDVKNIDTLDYSSYSSSNLKISTNSKNLAYVIYTSGTTGKPKGVMIEHSGVCNLAIMQAESFGLTNTSRSIPCMIYASYVFDACVSEIFTTIVHGHTAHIVSNEVRHDVDLLSTYIDKNHIEVATIPPVLLSSDSLLNLKSLVVAGDKTDPKILKHYSSNGINIINAYGPTESTVCATYHSYQDGDISTNIGSTLPNITSYVLDSNFHALPIGASGELYIGGAGLARGYINRPDLTLEKFIPNPYQSEHDKRDGKNSRLYKTGDLVRYLANGQIDYIGRNDFQVKIRGYRIELGEIESKLSAYPNIKQAVVIAKERSSNIGDVDNDKHVIAYYVSDDRLDETLIMSYLSEQLPEYMVPSYIVPITQIPVTINGKLDRNALPDPKFTSVDNYVAPRNDVETKLCAIYAEILGLDISKVGINDDFFRLGGNSILAIRLVSKINRDLDYKINVSAIFKNKTILSLTESFITSQSDDVVINKAEVSTNNSYPLSFAQERLWFIEKYEGGSTAYNIPMVFKIDESADVTYLEQSILSIINRHEVLRSLIKTDSDGNGYQLIQDSNAKIQLINSIQIESFNKLHETLTNCANYIYDLEKESPIRISLITNKADNSRYLSILIHHIAFDGWSVDLFLKELKAHYKYFKHIASGIAELPPFEPLEIQYKDFALWQKSYLSGEKLANELSYWSNKLQSFESLNLPLDYPRPQMIDYRGSIVNFSINDSTSKALRSIAKELGVSLYSVLLGGFYLMLRGYSNQNDIIVGTPIANRNYNQIEGLIGFFVNTLALRININSESSLSQFIKNVGKEIVDAQLHQDLPFEKLVEDLHINKDQSQHPIFQVMFSVNSFGNSGNEIIPSDQLLTRYNEADNFTTAKFDLSTTIDDSQDVLKGRFNYAMSLFNENSIEGMVSTYLTLLDQIASISISNPKPIKELNYLNKDYQTIIFDWNKTAKPYPEGMLIHQMFEKQVNITPDNIALVYENTKLTYRELNEKSNMLANYLKDTYQITADNLIPLYLDRSEHMLIAILGVMKSGGAYVPMDPGYPTERIEYILSDSKAKVVITNECYKEKLADIKDSAKLLVGVELIDSTEYNMHALSNPSCDIKSNNLAYVIYTSGTTGKPKGVMIEHQGVVSLTYSLSEKYSINESEHILLFANYVFDASVEQMWLALSSGSQLVVINGSDVRDPDKLMELIIKNQITHLHVTPAYLETLDPMKLNTLRRLISGGEYLAPKLYQKLAKHVKNIINEYGPTETTVTSLVSYDETTIGRPVENYTTYILDSDLNILPVGAIGELYIGGDGLARGYLNRPDLTMEKFVPNPFQTETEKLLGKNKRMYKTGDLVRYLSDGKISYMGRNDFQVKIRGYRIELGEIENRLLTYSGIKNAVVLANDNPNSNGSSNKYLVGYYVSENKISDNLLISYLSEHLPEYMIPAIFMHLNKLPITINGKLDRKALPLPEFTNSSNYIASRNDMERKLCNFYAETLGLDAANIGIKDDFFKLGGNSILVIKLVNKINKHYNSHLKIAEVFSAKTVERLVKLTMSTTTSYKNIISLNYTENKPLMFMVHPASAGCEVYTSLADRLHEHYTCYGIDNYNLYNEEKFKTLGDLTTHYLNIMKETNSLENQAISLLGWSMGGFISLELASILEQQGYTNIKVYLLDTMIVNDEKLSSLLGGEDFKKKYGQYFIDNYGADYAKKQMDNYEVEHEINKQPISNKLKHTKVTLFKACQKETKVESETMDMLFEYKKGLNYNNIENVLHDLRQIKVINIEGANHGNIIEHEEVLLSEITNL